jgi:hypothetical protein
MQKGGRAARCFGGPYDRDLVVTPLSGWVLTPVRTGLTLLPPSTTGVIASY